MSSSSSSHQPNHPHSNQTSSSSSSSTSQNNSNVQKLQDRIDSSGFPSDFPTQPPNTTTQPSSSTPSMFPTDNNIHHLHSQDQSNDTHQNKFLEPNEQQQQTQQQSSSRSTAGLLYHGTTQQRTRTRKPSIRSSREPRKCWICYDDDEEDEEEEEEEEEGDGLKDQSETRDKSSGGDDPRGGGEGDRSERGAGKSEKRKRKRKKQDWVRACQCSLTAHESCLLTWITTYQLSNSPPSNTISPLSTPVKCPQCDTPYKLSQPDYRFLDFLYRLKRPYISCLSWSALGFVFLGLGVTTSSYGLWASRCFLGQNRWNRWISSSENWRGMSFIKMFQLSLVGPILILSRTRQLDSVLPFLPVSLILSNLTNLRNDLSSPSPPIDHQLIRLGTIYPPDPALTLCLIPWARVGWNWVWGKITDFILRREYNSLSHLGLSYRSASAATRLARQGIRRRDQDNGGRVGLGMGAVEVAVEVGGAVGGNDEDDDEDDDDDDEDEGGAMGAQPGVGEVHLDYTTLRGVIRMGTEALFLPGAAALAGNFLLLLSKNRSWLKTILGLQRSSNVFRNSLINRITQTFRKFTGLSTVNLSMPTMIGLRSYESNNRFDPKRLFERLNHIPGGATAAKLYVDDYDYDDREGLLGFGNEGGVEGYDYDYFGLGGVSSGRSEDPVWWRNAIGGGMIIVFKDVLGLVEKVMKLRKLSKRKIIEV